MNESVIQYVLPSLIGGMVVIVSKAADVILTAISKKQGKYIDVKTFRKGLTEIKQEINEEVRKNLETCKSVSCPDLSKLSIRNDQIQSELKNIQEEIRKNGEITSNSLQYLIREKEYKAKYIAKKREYRKYFREGTPIFRFSILQFENIESIAFSVCEDYLNTKIVDSEDITLTENQITQTIETIKREGSSILGTSMIDGYIHILEKQYSKYSAELRKIFIDKENDKVKRVHTLSLKLSDDMIEELRDYHIRFLEEEAHHE